LIYSLAGLLSKAIGFVMLPVYAHYLRGEGYGMIGMIDVVLSVLTLLIGRGIRASMMRFYYQRVDLLARNVLISTGVLLMFALVVAVSTPVLILSEQVATLAFGKTGYGHYIILAGLTFICEMTATNAEVYILIKEKSLFYSFLALCRLILGLSLNIFFIVYLELGVLGYLYSGLSVAIVFTSIIHGYTLLKVGLHFDRSDAREILAFSLPLLPGYVAMFIRDNTDRILLRSFLGLVQLGAFEMLFKFATLIGYLVVEPFSKIWGVKRFEIADTEDGPTVMARVYTLLLSIMLYIGLVLGIEIPIILKILTPEEFWLGNFVVGLAVLSRIILASYYHFFFGLLYAKKTHTISIIQIVTTVVNLPLALLLIKPFGIAGAVIVSCLSNSFQCALAYKCAKKYYIIPFEWKRLIAIISFACLLYFLIMKVTLSGNEGVSNWIIGIVFQPLSVGMGFLHLDSFKGGKIVAYILTNIPLIVEGVVKFFLSFVFVGGLIAGNIIPRSKITALFKKKSLNVLFNQQ